jgi:hypothetical protein
MRDELSRTGSVAAWSDIAVLVRNRQELAELAGAFRRGGVPAEVVGLSGLLSQPEVADVVATLRVISDLTANAALLRLLTGPRWRIGVRDLALLGERSADLVRGAGHGDERELDAALDAAVAGIDPTEVASLSDALADPGHKGYSPEALERFAALAAELSALRRATGEPLTDLVRKIVLTLGLDVELAAADGPDAQQAAENLASLMETVSDFAARDPYASVHALVAYLDAELAFNRGMGVAEPTRSDSVKLLTAHTAKGLEWRGVLVPFMSAGVFPSVKGRPRWEWSAKDVPWPLRGDRQGLPALREWTSSGIDDYAAACRGHAELEERRLAYVAVTRAKELLVASGHWWGRTQLRPRGPSSYLNELAAHVDPGRRPSPGSPTFPTRVRPTLRSTGSRRCTSLAASTRGGCSVAGEPRRRCPRPSPRTAARHCGWELPDPRPRRHQGRVRTSRRPCWTRPASTSPRWTGRSPRWWPRRRRRLGPWSRWSSRPPCPPPRCRVCATTPTFSLATSRVRFRASRRRALDSEPGSTAGSRPAWASSRSSTPRTCPVGSTPTSRTSRIWRA